MVIDQKLLNSIYYNPASAGSFGSIKNLVLEAKTILPNIEIKQIKDWLEKQKSYSLFKKVKYKFPRLRTLTNEIDEQWQADLMDVSWYADKNNGTRFLLVVIDLFSRYAWVRPLKNKSAEAVVKAMKSIFREKRIPKKMQTDQGKEFKNKHFKQLMSEFNINFFTTTDDTVKCAIVERFNRTLRSRIYRYMYHVNSTRFIDALDDIVQGYNNNFHTSIKEIPSNVNKENEAKIARTQKESKIKNMKDKHKGVTSVRLAIKKNIFDKGSTKNWTNEVFKIVSRKKTPTTYIYKLEDLDGEPITSIFYPDELSPASI